MVILYLGICLDLKLDILKRFIVERKFTGLTRVMTYWAPIMVLRPCIGSFSLLKLAWKVCLWSEIYKCDSDVFNVCLMVWKLREWFDLRFLVLMLFMVFWVFRLVWKMYFGLVCFGRSRGGAGCDSRWFQIFSDGFCITGSGSSHLRWYES